MALVYGMAGVQCFINTISIYQIMHDHLHWNKLKVLPIVWNFVSHIALRVTKTLWSFGNSECKMVKADFFFGC